MAPIIELTPDQILQAVRQLPFEERSRVYKMLREEEKQEINLAFDNALAQIHAANPGLSEDEVMTEVNELVHQIRAERHAESGR